MEVNIEQLENLFDSKLEPINTKLAAIEESVGNHSTQLDGIAKDVKKLLDEKTVTAKRLDRLEGWGQKAGEKLNLKLEL